MPTLPRRVSRRPLRIAAPFYSYTWDEVIAMLQQLAAARPGHFVAVGIIVENMLKQLEPTAGRRLVRRPSRAS